MAASRNPDAAATRLRRPVHRSRATSSPKPISSRELAELTRAANRANATLYTIDPRGLVGGPDLDEQVDTVEWQNYVRTTQDSLRVLAEQTGGIAVVNQNDFDKALKRIDDETSDYYVLGYYSTNPDPLKRTRRDRGQGQPAESERMVTADVLVEAESAARRRRLST